MAGTPSGGPDDACRPISSVALRIAAASAPSHFATRAYMVVLLWSFRRPYPDVYVVSGAPPKVGTRKIRPLDGVDESRFLSSGRGGPMRFVALMSGCLVAMLAVAGGASASTLAVNQAGVLRLDARFGEVNGVTLPRGFPIRRTSSTIRRV